MRETATFTDSDTLSSTIVDAVSDVTGSDPLELPVLYEVVETDALRELVSPPTHGFDGEVTISFEMAGCKVTVSNAGTVTVTDSPRTYVDTPVSP